MSLPTPLLVATLTALVGLAAFLGALFGHWNAARGNAVGGKGKRAIAAFGGGAMIGAVGLLLLPHGLKAEPIALAVGGFVAGGLVFAGIDHLLRGHDHPVSDLVALNLDFLPEAIVIGAVATSEPMTALVIAVIVGLQNLPDGFDAYNDICQSHEDFLRHHVLLVMALAIVMGPLAGLAGLALFETGGIGLALVVAFGAGGIVYLVFEDVAPEARVEGEWKPAYGAVAGFAVALVGAGVTH